MAYPSPIYCGQYPALKASATDDFGLDCTNDLATGETLSSVDFTVTDSDGDTVAGVVTASTVSSPNVSFRVAAPATEGMYQILMACTYSDTRVLYRTASLRVVA